MNAICRICKIEISCNNESEESILARGGEFIHFECAFKDIHGKEWVEPEWLKRLNKTS